ncbi:hypothetical protein [Cellulomonas gilvus]|uniref:SAF domain protein n=1 Tax=Cellulomonas gilvus (strain ATCC 13127 / NRRL B-14078) TaxID=593907 RepID=F8A1B6_CELGA|nr:hypothetical protein [Cellulomonas gilvus]AEI11663.1 hypothetical protein Celgi_1144 [Cellulomonas gilvus ATCC 13127]
MDTALLDLPAPTAARLRRPGWRDPRLLAGIAMVAAAVALGAWAVRTAQATVAVYAVRDTLVPGATLDADDLLVVDVRVPDAALAGYLPADEAVPQDAVLLRTVGAGELLPRSAVGAAADVAVRPIAVPVDSRPSDEVVPGAVVDVWFTPAAPTGSAARDAEPGAPRLLAAGVTVAEVATPDGAFSAGGSSVVHVLVPQDGLPDLLTALAADGTLVTVPVPGSGR